MRRLIVSLTAAIAAAAVLGMAVSAAAGPSPTADYRFLDSNVSSVGSAPALVDLNIHGNVNNRFQKEVADPGEPARSVLEFPQGNGLQLSPTTGIVGNGVYTIVMRFRLADTSSWRRLVDFKNGTDDSGLYQVDGALEIFPHTEAPTGVIKPNTFVTVALTRDAAGVATGYVDGVQQFVVDDSSHEYALIDASNTLRFFRDNDQGSSPGEESAGAVARIVLFDTALTPAEIGAFSTSVPAPVVTVDPAAAPVGATVHVRGSGFLPGDTVHLAFVQGRVRTALPDATAGADDSFDRSVTIPAARVGNARITATGSWGGVRFTLFRVTAR